MITEEQIRALTERLIELRTWRVPIAVPARGAQTLIVKDATKEHAIAIARGIAKSQGWTITGEPVEFVAPVGDPPPVGEAPP